MKTHAIVVTCALLGCLAVFPAMRLAQGTVPVPPPPRHMGLLPPDSTPALPTNVAAPRNGPWTLMVEKRIAASKLRADSTQLLFDGASITEYFATHGKAAWDAHFGPLGAIDFGCAGDMTQNLLWRLDHGQADGMNPKLIALLIGTNNLHTKSTPADIAAGIGAIVTAYRKKCPHAVILIQALPPCGRLATDPNRAKVKAVNALLPALADGTTVVFIDFGDRFLSADGSIDPAIMPDFEHPSPKGYEIWAEAIRPMVDKYCLAK